MADKKPTSLYYSNLGGINLKASEYTVGQAQFLDIRNMDFDVPNALQKRPGQTQAVSASTSGPVLGLFEYQRLTGESWVVAGSNSALFYLAGNAYTTLDTGWNNSQPQDFLTFVNKMWVADGGRYKSWDGGVSFGVQQVGLPCPRSYGGSLVPNIWSADGSSNGWSAFLVAGATHLTPASSFVCRGVFVAYSYVRADGYEGPLDLSQTAKNIVRSDPNAQGGEFFGTHDKVYGVTVPTGYGISAIKLWAAVDTSVAATVQTVVGYGASGAPIYGKAGNLGWVNVDTNVGLGFRYMSVSLKIGADLSRFHYIGTVPAASFITTSLSGETFFGVTMPSFAFSDLDGIATGSAAFSGVPFCWFETNTPKYIDVNQNVVFMSGFSNSPSVMWFTDIGEPESVQPNYSFEIRTNDGDRMTGHKAYNNTIVAFKENSFHKVIGSTPEDFQLVELSTQFGLLSNRAVVEFEEKLAWLDKKGIVQYDGAGWRIISDQIDEIFRRMNLSAARENAVAVHWKYRNQIWFGIPVDGSTQNNLTIVYDYLIKAFTFFDGFNASSFAFIKSTLDKPTVWRGSPSGMIYYFGESFYGDSGQGISCVPFTRFEQFKGENSTNVWRRLFLDVGAVTGLTGVINGLVFKDYNRNSVASTFAMYQNVFQSKAEMGVVGKAVAVQFSHYSASLPFLLNGFAWQKRNLRNV